MPTPRQRIRGLLDRVATTSGPGELGAANLIGDIGGVTLSEVPALAPDSEFGPAAGVPMVMEVSVAEDAGGPARVGRIVKRRLFPHVPPFLFNVCFACGKSTDRAPSPYTDPRSHWFDVFMGYYEIDVPRATWARPFGYLADGRPFLEDMVRIGKADWNYFSNYVYGVPEAECARYDAIDLAAAKAQHLGRETVGTSDWDVVELGAVEVVSAHVRSASQLRVPDIVFTPLWRRAFGQPVERPDAGPSFRPATMRGRFYMAFDEGHEAGIGDAYRTYVFGGTVNRAFDRDQNGRFLAEQLAAVRAVMVEHYPDLGFRS